MIRFDEVEVRLRQALQHPLPGPAVQLRMAPRPRAPWRKGVHPAAPRAAAGLLLCVPHRGSGRVVLTVRSQALLQHGGQVSLPGGAVEARESVEQAALREAREEIGVDPARLVLLGRLTPLDVPVSGFRLHPVVAMADRPPRLRPATTEVSRILAVPIATLMDPGTVKRRTRIRGGRRFEAPYFDLDGIEVWGATAMILAEFLALLGHALDPWTDPGGRRRLSG